MDFLIPRDIQIANTVKDLELCNRETEEYGLALSATQMLTLAQRRVEALQNTNRVEFGEGILKKLIFIFRDSPYLAPWGYAETLAELQDAFYHFKNESGERLSDDELLDIMKEAFDGKAQGSVEYLTGTVLETLCKGLRGWVPDEEVAERNDDG